MRANPLPRMTMAKKSKFNPFIDEQLFEAEKNKGLPLRIAYLGLVAESDKNGCFPWMPRTLKHKICPHDDGVIFTDVLEVLEALALIEHHDEHGVVVALKKEVI